jgi:hypothetical protein
MQYFQLNRNCEYFTRNSEFLLEFVVTGGQGRQSAKLDKFEWGVSVGGWLKRLRSVCPCKCVLR